MDHIIKLFRAFAATPLVMASSSWGTFPSVML